MRQQLAGQRVEGDDLLDGVAEQRDPVGAVLVGRVDFEHIAAHPERPRREVDVIAGVLNLHQTAQHGLAPDFTADVDFEDRVRPRLGIARSVNARDRGDDNHVLAREQGGFRGDAQPLDLLVDVGLFLDVKVVARHIRFRLIIVVVAHVVFDRVAREELLELGVKLRRERLVVGEDQRRALSLLDDLGDGEGLAGAGRAEQNLVVITLVQPLDQLGNRGGLIARRLELGYQFKRWHMSLRFLIERQFVYYSGILPVIHGLIGRS